MIDYPDDADGDALRRVAADSDMSKPMRIDFAVAVPNENAGKNIAEQAWIRGYETSVVYDKVGNRWTCYCIKEMVPTYEGVVNAQRELDELSRPLGGYSDGWGTSGN